MNAVLATKRIKIAEATCRQINYLVAKCQGLTVSLSLDPTEDQGCVIRTYCEHGRMQFYLPGGKVWSPSTIPNQGAPILYQHLIATEPYHAKELGPDRMRWRAHKYKPRLRSPDYPQCGDYPMQAGLRCYLLSCLGEEAEMPVELC